MPGTRREFQIQINAPAIEVWQHMIDAKDYVDWTTPFCEGSYFEGSWEKGTTIRFLSPQGGGMYSRIVENRKGEFISIEHLGEISATGEIDTESERVRSWAPAFENYHFVAKDGGTLLRIEMDVSQEWDDYMQSTWPKALERLKAIAEA